MGLIFGPGADIWAGAYIWIEVSVSTCGGLIHFPSYIPLNIRRKMYKPTTSTNAHLNPSPPNISAPEYKSPEYKPSI